MQQITCHRLVLPDALHDAKRGGAVQAQAGGPAQLHISHICCGGFHDHKTCKNHKWKQKLRQHARNKRCDKGSEKRAPMGYAHHRTSSEMVRPLYRLPICTRPSLRVEVVPFQV